MADPLLKYHPFPSPERYSKEQQVINFKQKGHLNIQKRRRTIAALIINQAGGFPRGIHMQGICFCTIYFSVWGLRRAAAAQRGSSGAGRWGWRDGGREECQTDWNQHRPKPAGEPKPCNFELGKGKDVPCPAWVLQTIYSKGRDVSHSSV